MIDLNVQPYPPDEDLLYGDEGPRTDVLYQQRMVLDMDKYVCWSAYNQRMISIPPVFSQRYKMVKAVRFVKTCQQWHYYRDFDGSQAEYQCTDEAQYIIVDWSDNPNEPTVTLACNAHADECLTSTDHEWYEVLYMVDKTPVSV
jgi:hypothetical protein